MRSNFDTNEYVKNLIMAGLARAQVTSEGRAARPEDAATVADLERLKVRIDEAAARAEAEPDLAANLVLEYLGFEGTDGTDADVTE